MGRREISQLKSDVKKYEKWDDGVVSSIVGKIVGNREESSGGPSQNDVAWAQVGLALPSACEDAHNPRNVLAMYSTP